VSGFFEGMRRARILIPDNTPLSLLAMIGQTALDWLFAPGAEVWVTDMVREEALRLPDHDDDKRDVHRAELVAWFERNAQLIHVQTTDEGEQFREAMENWRALGSPPERKPRSRGRGERSILQVLDGVEKLVADGEAVLAIVDDRKARAAIKLLTELDIDLLATESFLVMIVEDYRVKEAETAWLAIRIASGGKAGSRRRPGAHLQGRVEPLGRNDASKEVAGVG
jgi:hypothetical protein